MSHFSLFLIYEETTSSYIVEAMSTRQFRRKVKLFTWHRYDSSLGLPQPQKIKQTVKLNITVQRMITPQIITKSSNCQNGTPCPRKNQE